MVVKLVRLEIEIKRNMNNLKNVVTRYCLRLNGEIKFVMKKFRRRFVRMSLKSRR